jgi:hypothetical protein
MKLTRPCLAALAAVSLAACHVGHRNEHIATPADVEMEASALAKFQHEIEEYVDLHQELLHRIPSVGPRASPEEMAAHRTKMTKGILDERSQARQGEIFKPKVEAAFRRLFATELGKPEHQGWLHELLSGNPKSEGVPSQSDPSKEVTEKAPTVAVNVTYDERAPLSSVPPTLLSKMPPLPEQVRYRFVGRDLVLLDGEANVILDFINGAISDHALPR